MKSVTEEIQQYLWEKNKLIPLHLFCFLSAVHFCVCVCNIIWYSQKLTSNTCKMPQNITSYSWPSMLCRLSSGISHPYSVVWEQEKQSAGKYPHMYYFIKIIWVRIINRKLTDQMKVPYGSVEEERTMQWCGFCVVMWTNVIGYL